MKLNKVVLIELIETIEKSVKAQQAEHDKAFAKYTASKEAEWKALQLPTYKKLRDFLTAKIKVKGLITNQELADLGFKNRWGSLEFDTWSPARPSHSFTVDGKNFNGYPVMDKRLAELRAALNVISDAEVSTSALAGMGFRNLEWFFRKAAEAQAS